jgi:ribosomal protein S15P/S13E
MTMDELNLRIRVLTEELEKNPKNASLKIALALYLSKRKRMI